MNKWFLDASFAIALLAPRDALHQKAKAAATEIKRRRLPILTMTAVLLEVGDELSRRADRPATIRFVKSLITDPAVEIIDTTSEWLAKGFILYGSRPDKEWGLTDCVSFIVMQEHGLTDALTADRHFQQAGFRALLLEENAP